MPLEQKVDLLLAANAEALKVDKVKYVNSVLFFVKQDRSYANTDGSVIEQTLVRSGPLFTATAVSSDFTDFQSRQGVEAAPMGRGWKYILGCDLAGNARVWGEEAAQKLTAKPVDVGRYDLVLHPSNLWLTIHESIGHPTELDRALATRPTTPAPVSSRHPRPGSASSSTDRRSRTSRATARRSVRSRPSATMTTVCSPTTS